MNLYEKLIKKQEKLAVVGLGYVGMPLAVAFAKKLDVIGFDINEKKIKEYQSGNDITNEVGNEELSKSTVKFTFDENELKNAKFLIVAVPTPVKSDTTPDLTPVIKASEVVGRNLSKGSIIIFESTVYPGVTEEICIPILEKESGLKCKIDFKVGYSPERINPGDKINTIDKIVKIVSAIDKESLSDVAKIYELIIKAGVYRAESIKVAEAAKVIENSQRDINIAFVNELSMIFNKMGIDTLEVLKAASTKWNFLKFYPGLVGGHCIGVDPYYLTYRAKQLGFNSKVVSAGREINSRVPKFIVENVIKSLILNDKKVKGSKIGIIGMTFKENCPDIRNSKVFNIINELKQYAVEILCYDPLANKEEVFDEYSLVLNDIKDFNHLDLLIIAVNHKEVMDFSLDILEEMFIDKKIIFDLKGVFNKKQLEEKNFQYWRL